MAMTAVKRVWIIEAYKSGKTCPEIGVRLGMTPGAVMGVLRRARKVGYDIPKTPGNRGRNVGGAITPFVKEGIIATWNRGLTTTSQLMAIYGLTKSQVDGCLKRARDNGLITYRPTPSDRGKRAQAAQRANAGEDAYMGRMRALAPLGGHASQVVRRAQLGDDGYQKSMGDLSRKGTEAIRKKPLASLHSESVLSSCKEGD